ncbi:MAG: SMC-Scp complex subunit ScpB [Clostridia bacterium]|nr:SMC-Scp complex subunit ScpB [Clostridia bacterium]
MNIDAVIESLLFVSGDGLAISQIAEILEITEEETKKQVDKLKVFYKDNKRGIEIVEYDGYIQLKTPGDNFLYVTKLAESKRKQPLSPAALEALSIVAYHQPVTRSSVEFIRGVNSDGPMSRLVERGLIEETGRLDAPGRPILYSTTKEFLRSFGLSSLKDLPDIEDLAAQFPYLAVEEASGEQIAVTDSEELPTEPEDETNE